MFLPSLQWAHKEAEFYQSCLLYLAYTDVELLTADQRREIAYDLGVAALLGEGIYNFGELVRTGWFPRMLALFCIFSSSFLVNAWEHTCMFVSPYLCLCASAYASRVCVCVCVSMCLSVFFLSFCLSVFV